MKLVEPVDVGGHRAPSRVVFGPHETNLGLGRSLSERHTTYYRRRAAGGAGLIVTETASVTANDWPYERAPLAAECPAGWRDLARACEPHGTVVLAGLGHAGSQGSSAYSQEVMWAPSRVADVVSREPPAELDEAGIENVVTGFGRAAARARDAGLAGVEIDAGAWSLLRQFHSGLTNLRTDVYGTDRLFLTRRVLAEVRREVGRDGIVALRLSGDELAPWAGITPEQAETMVADLADQVDLLTVVRGGPYSTSAYRPDFHVPAGFNLDLGRRIRSAVGGRIPVVLQGSVVDPAAADSAIEDQGCDLVEMTRALIADADLVTRVRGGRPVRPCIRCNQACQVRDPRNPIVSCVMDPSSGYELEPPTAWAGGQGPPRSGGGWGWGPDRAPTGHERALIVGAGPAGLECARLLAEAGWRVRVAERGPQPGGALALTGREHLLRATDWLVAAAIDSGAQIETATEVAAADVRRARADGWEVVLATGARFDAGRFGGAAHDPLEVLAGRVALPSGLVAIIDPVGDSVGVDLAERLAASREVALISPDPVAGTQLSRTGDLADANVRLQRAGVTRWLRRVVRSVRAGSVTVEDHWTGEVDTIAAAAVIDCGHRLADDRLYAELGDPAVTRVGDCVAPRTLLEAVLEGRQAATALLTPAAARRPA